MSHAQIDFVTPMIYFPEPKFEVTSNIYEFWNTISNILYLIIGFREKNNFGVYIIIIGISSALFHGSGLLIFEIADELSIMIMICIVLDKFKYIYPWMLIPIYIIFLPYKNFYIFYNILNLLSFIAIIEIKKFSVATNKNFLFNRMICYFLIAKIFWYIDQVQTQYWQGHMIWHIFSSIALKYTCMIIG